ncbi:uncharacterized protein LOC143202398 [Rhynchophorus ferrugineus]
MNAVTKSYVCKKDGLLGFFRNQKFVDCTFLIENKEVKAHKLVLASKSVVFEKMLFGDLASDLIVLDDAEANEFNQMLEFVYTDQISFTSMSNAWSMFYLARKYLLDDLVEKCMKYISDNLTINTLVLSYEYSELYNETELKNQCLSDITSVISGIFVSDYHMKSSTLRTLLQRDLGLPKIDLVCKIIEWAATECEFRKVTASAAQIVKILQEEDVVSFINKKWLINLSCDYCNDSVLVCQCFGELVHETLVLLSGETMWENDSCDIPRLLKPTPTLCKSKKVFKIAQRLDLADGEEFVTSVVVSTDTVVTGVVICTEMKCSTDCGDSYKGCVMVRFCEDNSDANIVRPTVIREQFSYDSQMYIPLRFAAVLAAGKVYDIRISYKNYLQPRSSVVCSYMSDKLENHNPKCAMWFFDFNGTLLKGATFYPL